MQVKADCEPLIPFQQGALRSSANFPKGIYGDTLEYDTPYAHYQYIGEIYGPNIPKFDGDSNLIGFWSPPKKHPTGKQIKQHAVGTTDHWFETAKERHLDEWVDLVRETVGKG